MGAARDIAVIGGGVIGLSAAYFLAREGLGVTVLDRGQIGQEASWAGAGIIPPGNPARARSPFDRLRSLSSAYFPTLSADLKERTGIDNGYVRCGGLEFLGHHEHAAADEWRGEGVQVEDLSEQQSRALEPALAPDLGSALLLPDLAQVRNPRHLQALRAACERLGVCFRPACPVQSLDVHSGRIHSLTTPEGKLRADVYILTAGAWSDALLAPLGWKPGIRPIRGQVALLNLEQPLVRHVLLWGPRYLVPRLDGRILIGSTEEDVGFDKRTTVAAIHDILHFGCQLVPALATADVERCWAGLRPGTADGLPYLGPVPGIDNAFVAAGHFRAGIQLSPGTAMLLKELILQQPTSMPLEPFRLDRPNSPR